jgi:ATP-binding cassette, subfamily B, bacterial PglK
MRVLLEVWSLLDARQRRRLLGLQIVSMLMALSTVVGVATVLPFFAVLADPQSIHRSPVLASLYNGLGFTDESRYVVALGFGFVAAVFLSNGVNLLGAAAMNRYAHAVGVRFSVTLFGEYLQREYRFHAGASSPTLTGNILYEIPRLTDGVLQNGLTLVTGIFTTVCIVASMILFSPVITMVAMAGVGGSYALIYFVTRRRLRANGLIETRLLSERGKVVAEGLAAIKEILLLRAHGLFVDRLSHSCQALSVAQRSTWSIAQSPRYILECLAVVGLVGVALLLGGRPHDGRPWLAHLTFVGFATYRLLPALQQSFMAIVRIRANSSSLSSVAADLRRAQSRQETTRRVESAGSWTGRPRHEIQLKNVSFSFAPDAPVVRAISMRIPARAMIGVVGPNGSGKSTLADLILGLLSPQSGHVEVDGVVVDAITTPAWQSTVAYVPQQIVLVDATIAENIAFGVASADIDHSRLAHAARLAQLDELLASLPNGVAERVGDRGLRLSGGERQRLGIARALYRDSSLLILDEATSALDMVAERKILAALADLRDEKTIIVIAHRETALQFCDLILELDHGRVMRRTSYEQWRRQSQDFQASL